MKVDDLYASVRSAFSMANTQENESLFLASLRSVVVTLNARLGESIQAPTEIGADEIGFESYCDGVFYAGVKYYLQRLGRFAQDPDMETKHLYESELAMVIGAAITADGDDFETRNQ
jgi:hypothetical protein